MLPVHAVNLEDMEQRDSGVCSYTHAPHRTAGSGQESTGMARSGVLGTADILDVEPGALGEVQQGNK